MSSPKREHKVERVKRERDGLDALVDLLRYAPGGFAAIPEDDLEVRLRWYGLYTQRPKEAGLFMLRVKIPNGTVTPAQLEALGNLSIRYGDNTGDITTRQDIQFHSIRIEDVPAIFAELARIGLTSSGACGDITRNITGCAVAGIDRNELIDAEPIVEQVHQFFLNNREFSNLPRKFKITISGCAGHCSNHEINDIGLIALRREDGAIVFDLWVGGGLGAKERFADRLGVHLTPEEIPAVAAHICALFRDFGNREYRTKARLKFLLEEWGPEKFLQELETRLGRKLLRGAAPQVPVTANRAHLGVHAQKTPGLFYVGAAVQGGLFHGTDMLALANFAREAGSNRVRLTTTQNFVVLDVPGPAVVRLEHQLAERGFQTNPSSFRSGTLACTGTQFCKLALVETKARAAELVEFLEREVPGFTTPLRISVTGCPNSCAHYQVCDIGFVGDMIRTPAGPKEAFRVFLGGHLGTGHVFGRELDKKIPAESIKDYARQLARTYLERRHSTTESFQAFIARHSVAELEQLA